MTPFEFAWSVLKADFARPLPGMTNFASQNEPNKGQFANLYENEEVKDVNEALRQLGVAPEGLTAEMANYAPGFARHSAYDTTAMPREFREASPISTLQNIRRKEPRHSLFPYS